MFCRSLFVLLYFFFWPLCCLFLRFTCEGWHLLTLGEHLHDRIIWLRRAVWVHNTSVNHPTLRKQNIYLSWYIVYNLLLGHADFYRNGQRVKSHYCFCTDRVVTENLSMRSALWSSHTYLKVAFSCPVVDNFIWIKPVLWGHLFFVSMSTSCLNVFLTEIQGNFIFGLFPFVLTAKNLIA
jgi:hypothetical protein